MNPEEQWVRKHVPDLRIIQQDIFEAVQKLKTERGGARPDQQRNAALFPKSKAEALEIDIFYDDARPLKGDTVSK